MQEYDQLYSELCNDHSDKEALEILKTSTNQAVQTVLAWRNKTREIRNWIAEQPEWVAACEKDDAVIKAHHEAEDKLSFSGNKLNRAGTLIEYENNGKICQMMIGTINQLGGACDDCMGIGDSTIILRYKVLWDGSDNHVSNK